MVGHLGRIECLTAAADHNSNIVISSDLKHRVLTWNSSTGECLEELQLPGLTADHQVIPVWTIDASDSLVAIGYKDGTLALFDVYTGRFLGQYGSQSAGVIHLKLLSDQTGAILARYPGSIEILRFMSTESGSIDVHLQHSTIAHQQPITVMHVAGSRIYTGSSDYTIKMFNAVSDHEIPPTLVGHHATISSLLIDEEWNALISSCTAGMICAWDLTASKLNYRISDFANAGNDDGLLSLTLTQRLLVGLSGDFSLWLWHRNSGDLITRIKQTERQAQKHFPFLSEPRIITVREDIVAIGGGKRVQIWDLASKMLLKETNFSGLKSSAEFVQHLIAVNENQAICCSFGTLLYRVAMPSDRI